LARDPATRAWEGLGLAVQAYGRRAPLVLDWVAALAQGSGRRMTVRLVKGAYWDSEIKRAQERGLATFPVYTSKAATDASYLECARQLLAARDVLYPQFATHNAYTVAAVLELAPPGAAYEFQRLQGMGEALYDAERANSEGEDFGDPAALAALEAEVERQAAETCSGGPVLSGRMVTDASTLVVSPADTRVTLGLTRDASAAEIRAAMQAAHEAQPAWDARGAAERAAC